MDAPPRRGDPPGHLSRLIDTGQPAAASALLARCEAVDARLLLLRRAHRDPTPTRAFAVADARPGREAIAWGRFEELLVGRAEAVTKEIEARSQSGWKVALPLVAAP